MGGDLVREYLQIMDPPELPSLREQVAFQVFLECLVEVEARSLQVPQSQKVLRPLKLPVTDPKPVLG